MPNWGAILGVTAGIAITGGICGGFMYLIHLDGEYREEINKTWKQEDRAERICYKIADKDKDGLTSIEEKVDMWKDLGWQVEEYMRDGAKYYSPIESQTIRTVGEKIKTYEEYIKENKYEFEYSHDSGYSLYKKEESLRK